MTRHLASVALVLAGTLLSAAAADTSPAIFNPRFQTLQVQLEGAFMLPPVARLGTSDRIIISFDEIADDYSELRYRLTHCNADWQPSRLMESEYLEGFNEAPVDDYAFSSNTYIHYVNYRIAIPSDDMQPLVSGNYLLQVYPQDDPSETILQARLSLAETMMPVAAGVTSRTDMGFNTEFQQLELAVDRSAFPVGNPYQDLVVTVEQNNSPDTRRTAAPPLRVEGNRIVYAHDPNLVFKASNEFRRFETVRIDYAGMHTESMEWGGSNYHAYLMTDGSRKDADYVYDSTQRGRFMIDEYNSTDPALGADYVTVHFTLDAPEVIGGDVYVDGDFTLHSRDDRYKMTYDVNDRLYRLQLPLKQGSYNYQYVVKARDGRTPATTSPIEGDKYETVNEYLVKVYHRPPGSRGDRLVGFATVASH